MPKLQGKNIVSQANALIEARYQVTKIEYFLLVAMISLIDPKDKEFLTFEATTEELYKILKVNKATVLREFDKVTDRLMSRVLTIKTEDGWEKYQWVSYARLKGNRVLLKFHDNLKPYLLELKESGNFTQSRLSNQIWFKSVYSSRIYQILREYFSKNMYTFEFELVDFRKIMLGEKNNSYPAFKEFKKFVLILSQKELSEIKGFDTNKKMPLYRSDLNFDLKTRRTGRKISHLIFTIKRQQTKPTKSIETSDEDKKDLPQIILDFHKFGITTEQVEPFLEERGEEVLKLTLNKIDSDHKSGKIKSNVPAYAFKLLEENAGQKTPQEKAEEETRAKLKVQREKEEKQKKRKALKHHLEIEFGDMARKNFLLSLNAEEKADIQYKIIQELQKAGHDMFIPSVLKDLGSRKVGGFLNKHIPNFNADKEIYIQEKLKEQGLL